MKYLLSIVIPTFNRVNFLRSQLDNLLIQLENINDIEILVCDNFSSDGTDLVIENYLKIYDCINYIKQGSNIGFDGNIYSCFENARGKYIWFLSDDDIIFDDALLTVYEFITKNNFSVLAFSFCDISSKLNYNKTLDTFRCHKSFADDISINDFYKVIMISTLILKKIDLDLNYLKSLKPTIFPQITLSLLILKEDFLLIAHDKTIIFREPGYISSNFFELYCLKPREAIKNAKIIKSNENRLLKVTEKSLKEFIYLCINAKLGFFKSKEGFPLKSFLNAFKEYKYEFRSILIIILLFLISRTPKELIKLLIYQSILIKTMSVRKIFEYNKMRKLHIEKNILGARGSDI